MAKQVLMPLAKLESRPTDIKFTEALYAKISLFAQLKKKLSLDKYPGTLVIRRYKAGELLCRQGEAGWTALYVLPTEDVLKIRQGQLEDLPPGRERSAVEKEIAELEQRAAQLKNAKPDDPLRKAATMHLTVARPTPTKKPGLVGRLLRRMSGQQSTEPEWQASIRIDGPADIDRETMQAPMHEDELYGEMSCLYGTPRSTTLVADRERYALEMLRNILEQLQKDAAYKERVDKLYKERSFQLHLRKLSLFSDLTEDQFKALKAKVDLLSFEAGQVIYDEFERSDSMYIIRSGLVKVIKKVSALLAQDAVRDWQALGKALVEGEKQAASPIGKIWALLPERSREAARISTQGKFVPETFRREILHGLNEIIKSRAVPDAKEFLPLIKRAIFAEHGFPDKPKKDVPDQDLRRFNRLLVEVVFEGQIRPYKRRVGPDRVLFYCSRGEFIGEMGVMTRQPRGESCIAHGHPQDTASGDAGRVEVVRIPAEVFGRLMQESPAIGQKVERKIAERKKQTQERMRVPIYDESRQVLFSEKFDKLGLMQGQRLMLIDLDRCTRCDECVRACVNTHEDGNSRLFLDGPRFGKYLVPTSCRSCLDPVCMIGCPVGSIHRGDNGEIAIEDWCIGCGLCAEQCPYGSIQMHDIGLISEDVLGWRYLPASAVASDKWMMPGFRDSHWILGRGPFQNDRVFRESVAPFEKADLKGPAQRGVSAYTLSELQMRSPAMAGGRPVQPLYFRLEFPLAPELGGQTAQLKLEVTSPDPNITVWVNGHEVQVAEKPRGGKREYQLPPKAAPAEGEEKAAKPAAPPKILCAGRNVLAIRVTPDAKSEVVFLKVRLDEIRKPAGVDAADEITFKVVTERAVVCDLCSTQLGQKPACVNACPHEAAFRVDARNDFPVD